MTQAQARHQPARVTSRAEVRRLRVRVAALEQTPAERMGATDG